MYGHLDNFRECNELSYIEQLNVLMDDLAKKSLPASITNRTFIDIRFLFEEIILTCGDQKALSSPTKTLHKWWSYKVARCLYHNNGTIEKSIVDHIYWKGMGTMMTKHFPRLFRTWLTKHISVFYEVNRHISKWTEKENICPSYKQENE